MNKHQMPSGSIGIVGLGLIGGSIGLELQSLGKKVHGLVNRAQTAQRAKERGLAQVISTDPAILSDCEVVIIALPIDQLMNPPLELIESLPSNAVITDVGSVKTPVLKVWNKFHKHFVGSHPMAGLASSGVDSGQLGLFKNRPWVITPLLNTCPDDVSVVNNLAIDLGSQVIISDAEKHDEAVALISHLPVLVSAALLKNLQSQNDSNITKLSKKLASSGFEDTTRVGGGNPDLGTSMAKYNKSAILKAITSYKSNLDFIEELIISEAWNELRNELQRTQLIRKDCVKKSSDI